MDSIWSLVGRTRKNIAGAVRYFRDSSFASVAVSQSLFWGLKPTISHCHLPWRSRIQFWGMATPSRRLWAQAGIERFGALHKADGVGSVVALQGDAGEVG